MIYQELLESTERRYCKYYVIFWKNKSSLPISSDKKYLKNHKTKPKKDPMVFWLPFTNICQTQANLLISLFCLHIFYPTRSCLASMNLAPFLHVPNKVFIHQISTSNKHLVRKHLVIISHADLSMTVYMFLSHIP